MQHFSFTARSDDAAPALTAISPRREMGAYEALWLEKGASFKSIAEKFAADPTALPSDFVSPSRADECAAEVMRILNTPLLACTARRDQARRRSGHRP